MTRTRVLFLCTHNSARSQMAEGFLRHLAGERFEVASAGTEATRVHPLAVRAMREVGVDLSTHTSKTLDGLLDRPWDYVITVCDSANERCPCFQVTRLGSIGASTTRPGPPEARTSGSIPSAASGTGFDAAEGVAGDDALTAGVESQTPMDLTTRLATLADAAAIAGSTTKGSRSGSRPSRPSPARRRRSRRQLPEKGDRYPTIVVERDGDGRRLGRGRAVSHAGGVRGRRRALRLHRPARARGRGRPHGPGGLDPRVRERVASGSSSPGSFPRTARV